MYELSIEELEMERVFGRNANILHRNGLHSVDEVKSYIEKHPFDEYRNNTTYYRYIGPSRYKQIIESLNTTEES